MIRTEIEDEKFCIDTVGYVHRPIGDFFASSTISIFHGGSSC